MESMNLLGSFYENIEENDPLKLRHRGIVVDNRDPLMIGRLKVKIEGIMEGPIGQLPWCLPIGQASLGGRCDCGPFIVPRISTVIGVTFPFSTLSMPFYDGIPVELTGSSQSLLFGEDYPDSYGFCDPSVQWLRVNMKKDSFEMYRKIGELLHIDGDGNVSINITGKLNVNIAKDVLINLQSNLEAVIKDNIDLTASDVKQALKVINIVATSLTESYSSGIDSSSGSNINLSASSSVNIVTPTLNASTTSISLGSTTTALGGGVSAGGGITASTLSVSSISAGSIATGAITAPSYPIGGGPSVGTPVSPSSAASAGAATSASKAKVEQMVIDMDNYILELKELLQNIEDSRDAAILTLKANTDNLNGSTVD